MSTAVPRTHLHHITLTVKDIDRSTRWYQEVFGVKEQIEEPHPGGAGRLLADESWQLLIGLSRHDAHRGESFDETRTGLDHVGFGVPTRQDLETWQAHLGEHGVARAEEADRPLTQSPIQDRPYGSLLTFRDPDNIQLQFFAPPGER